MGLRRVLSFNIPLIVTLSIFTIFGFVSKLLVEYENSISKDYSIVLVMNIPINETKLKELPSIDLKEIEYIKREKILNELKEDLTDGSFKMLQNKLPYFYNLYLKSFPTSSELKTIEKELKTLNGVKALETFSKNHDDLYSFLLLTKSITLILLIAIIIFTFLIINNQVTIWFYEHKERLEIIQLHGGTIFYGAKPIIKLALYSATISSIIVFGIFYFILENIQYFVLPEILNILNTYPLKFNLIEISYLLILALFISIITLFGVLLKHRIK